MSADGVEVVVPRRLPLADVEPFVESRREWVERTLDRLRAAEAERPRPLLADGGCLPYLGTELTLRVRADPGRRRPHVARRGDALEARVATLAREDVAAALERWYRGRARAEIGPRLDAAAARAGVTYADLQIRSQRTRWASCSAAGRMSFNWRLLLAPAAILDYVVEHEVVHLEVHDHSPRFRGLLAARWPAYREHEAWLRANGHTLRL